MSSRRRPWSCWVVGAIALLTPSDRDLLIVGGRVMVLIEGSPAHHPREPNERGSRPGASGPARLSWRQPPLAPGLDTERRVAHDTRGRRPAGSAGAARGGRSHPRPDAMRGGWPVVAVTTFTARLTTVTVGICGGDPLPRSGPGSLLPRRARH